MWLNNNGTGAGSQSGWFYRFVAFAYPGVAPESLGRIKALFR